MKEEDFTKLLPEYVRIDGVDCKVRTYFDGNSYQTVCLEFNGRHINWDNVKYNRTYSLGTPQTNEELSRYEKDGIGEYLRFETPYLIAGQVLSDLKKLDYEVIDEIIPKEDQFIRELAQLINKFSFENGSDTPDFILAAHLYNTLQTFNHTVSRREDWYGRKVRGSKIINEEI